MYKEECKVNPFLKGVQRKEVRGMKKQLEVFLPTTKNINEMNDDDFESWVHKAFIEIPERKIKRDPRSHLRKRISEIIDNESLSEFEKEDLIFINIKAYYKEASL